MLLLSDGLSLQSEAQFDPILRNRIFLRDTFGLVLRKQSLTAGDRIPASSLSGSDIIGFKLDYRTPQIEALRIASNLAKSKPKHSTLVYCDGNDEVTIQWPGLLEYCDLYWKKHCFRERSRYLVRPRGGTNLVEFALGEEAEPDSQHPCDESQLQKIFCGPSIGMDQKIANLAPLLSDNESIPTLITRKNDAVLRADVPDNWMGKLRRPAVEILESLQGSREILLPRGRVPQDQYAQEMMDSRISVSPFGYGEICWRDFEAIAYGCLLFKPSMDHIECYPDIFQPFESYVPVNWDFSDLSEKLDYFLSQPEESQRIVVRARQILQNCLRPEWYGKFFGELLNRLGYATPTSKNPDPDSLSWK